MGQIRHGSAATTYTDRAAIQRSQASLAQLSKERGTQGTLTTNAVALLNQNKRLISWLHARKLGSGLIAKT